MEPSAMIEDIIEASRVGDITWHARKGDYMGECQKASPGFRIYIDTGQSRGSGSVELLEDGGTKTFNLGIPDAERLHDYLVQNEADWQPQQRVVRQAFQEVLVDLMNSRGGVHGAYSRPHTNESRESVST